MLKHMLPRTMASVSERLKLPALFESSSDDDQLVTPPAGGVSKPARKVPNHFPHQGETAAVRDSLYGVGLASFRQLAAKFHVDYRWLMDVDVVAASRLLRAERARFKDLIHRLQEGQRDGVVKCVLFTWYIMSDETPWRVKVISVGHDTENADASIAKIMAMRTAFSCVVTVAPAALQDVRCGASQPTLSQDVHQLVSEDGPGDHYIIRGAS